MGAVYKLFPKSEEPCTQKGWNPCSTILYYTRFRTVLGVREKGCSCPGWQLFEVETKYKFRNFLIIFTKYILKRLINYWKLCIIHTHFLGVGRWCRYYCFHGGGNNAIIIYCMRRVADLRFFYWGCYFDSNN